MATKYQFNQDEIKEIFKTRRENKNKRIDRRLHMLEIMCEGHKNKGIPKATWYHEVYLKQIIFKYRKGGLKALTENHYPGYHRNLSYDEEAALLEEFEKQASDVQMINIAKEKHCRHSLSMF